MVRAIHEAVLRRRRVSRLRAAAAHVTFALRFQVWRKLRHLVGPVRWAMMLVLVLVMLVVVVLVVVLVMVVVMVVAQLTRPQPMVFFFLGSVRPARDFAISAAAATFENAARINECCSWCSAIRSCPPPP
jgi:hypothetical protein